MARPSDPFHLRSRDIRDSRVLTAMAKVPREAFIPDAHREEAFGDYPLPIGFGQTISQPYIVAWMTQELDVRPTHRVLEIGTGSGYQTAVLAELAAAVFSLEVIPELSARAQDTLERLGYTNLRLRVGSGYDGWPEEAPFDRILLTAAPPDIPSVLTDELRDGGRLIAPIGIDVQVIAVVERRGDRFDRRESIPVRFVPMR